MHVMIHVGMHKTASTYIQKMLLKNIELLRFHGIEYPVQSRDVLIESIKKRKLDPWIKLIKKSKPKATLLVSDERLSNILAQHQEDKLIVSNGNWLAKKLKPYCRKITIIGFVRDRPGFIILSFVKILKDFRGSLHQTFIHISKMSFQDNMIWMNVILKSSSRGL